MEQEEFPVNTLAVYIFCLYNKYMVKRGRGRPPKDEDRLHSESLIVRLETTEKEAFQDAAEIAGVPLSTWVRERLRQVAVRELQAAAQPIAFLKHLGRN